MKEAFLIVSRDEAEHLTDKNGNATMGAWVLAYLYPKIYKTPAMLEEVMRRVNICLARNIEPPSAFVFKAR